MKPFAVLGAALAFGSAVAARPAEITPFPPDWPHRAPWKLERSLLLPETESIVFVVDAPRGAPPFPAALDHLVGLAAKHGLRRASWVRLGDASAPRVDWIEPPAVAAVAREPVRVRGTTPLSELALSRDDLDTLRYLDAIPACPAGPLRADVAYVFVRYLGYVGGSYGNAGTVEAHGSCGRRTFPVIRIAQTRIARDRAPGIGREFLEKRALAHEYGHVLGLASNPAHGRWGRTVPYGGGAHCIHPDCAVAVPTATALLRGQMLDFCAACRRDFEQAREHWLHGKEFPEATRLLQPEPAAHVARLKDYNFREGGEAENLLGYGKTVMPALVARIAQLKGGSGDSPRASAARLAIRIVIAEDGLRRPPTAADPVLADPEADWSAVLLEWWRRESDRFLDGDDWALPPMLRASEAGNRVPADRAEPSPRSGAASRRKRPDPGSGIASARDPR